MRRTLCRLFAALTLLSTSSAIADVTDIDNAQLEMLRERGVAIIDVRRADEWQSTGVIAGSHPLTFFDAKGGYDAPAWLENLGSIVKPSQPVVLICASGVRSASIAGLLDKRLGFAEVYNVTGGINAWMKDGRAVEPYKTP